MNTGVYVTFQITVLSGYTQTNAQEWDYWIIWQFFSETSMLFQIAAVPIYITDNSSRWFPFLHTLYSIYYLQNFNDSYSDLCYVVSYCSLQVYSIVVLICISLIIMMIGIFLCTIGQQYVLEKCVFKFYAHFSMGFCCY